MQILLSCAKDMASTVCTYKEIKGSTPLFEQQARELAASMSNYSWEELGQILQINDKLALAFTGMAYRHLKATDFDKTEADFAQQHLWITSFLYGILRPLDEIKNHRLEGYVRLPENDDRSLFDYWKPLLTEKFIASVKKDDGVLLYLASEEMKGLFDWKRVKQEVQVVEKAAVTKPLLCIQRCVGVLWHDMSLPAVSQMLTTYLVLSMKAIAIRWISVRPNARYLFLTNLK